MPEKLVTLHAKLRWMERVEGRRLNEARQEVMKEKQLRPHQVTDAHIYYHILKQTGRTDCSFCDEILTPLRREAIKAGAANIKHDRFTLRCRDGRIVTVLDPTKDYCPERMAKSRAKRDRLKRGFQ